MGFTLDMVTGDIEDFGEQSAPKAKISPIDGLSQTEKLNLPIEQPQLITIDQTDVESIQYQPIPDSLIDENIDSFIDTMS